MKSSLLICAMIFRLISELAVTNAWKTMAETYSHGTEPPLAILPVPFELYFLESALPNHFLNLSSYS